MEKTNVQDALSRKYPQGIVMVAVLNDRGKANVMPASWYTQTSISPPMFAVSIAPKRLTYDLIRKREEFVLAFPSASQKRDILFCGTKSGRDVDKFEETNLQTAPPAEIETPIIEDSVACFECESAGGFDTGDHRIFSGEVVAAHVGRPVTEKIYNFGRYGKRGESAFKKVIEPDN